jgi:hypothetical protein
MSEKETDSRKEEERPEPTTDKRPSVEDGERPVPGVKHEREPDAENIMPAEDRPGTF